LDRWITEVWLGRTDLVKFPTNDSLRFEAAHQEKQRSQQRGRSRRGPRDGFRSLVLSRAFTDPRLSKAWIPTTGDGSRSGLGEAYFSWSRSKAQPDKTSCNLYRNPPPKQTPMLTGTFSGDVAGGASPTCLWGSGEVALHWHRRR
jgi:hypothetical protein